MDCIPKGWSQLKVYPLDPDGLLLGVFSCLLFDDKYLRQLQTKLYFWLTDSEVLVYDLIDSLFWGPWSHVYSTQGERTCTSWPVWNRTGRASSSNLLFVDAPQVTQVSHKVHFQKASHCFSVSPSWELSHQHSIHYNTAEANHSNLQVSFFFFLGFPVTIYTTADLLYLDNMFFILLVWWAPSTHESRKWNLNYIYISDVGTLGSTNLLRSQSPILCGPYRKVSSWEAS